MAAEFSSEAPRRIRFIHPRVVSWGAAALLSLFLAAVIGSYFDTRVWWLDILSQFRWHEMAGFSLLAVLSVVLRNRLKIGLALGALSLLGAVATSADVYRVARNEGGTNLSSSDALLRVIHFNVGSRTGSWQDVISWLEQQQADVIFLQEARPGLEAELKRSPLDSKIVLRNVRRDSRGTIALITGQATLVQARLDTALFEGTRRQLADLTVAFGPHTRQLLSVHMCRPTTPIEFGKQSYEFERLGGWMRSSRIAIGDINCTPYNARFRTALGPHPFAAANVGTWPAILPSAVGIATDACIVGAGDQIESAVAGPNLGSDHRPLIIRLRLGP